MKKILSLLTVCVLGIAIVFSLTACSEKTPPSSENDVTTPSIDTGNSTNESQPTDNSNPADDTSDSTNETSNALVVYFSVPDDRDNSYVEVGGERLGNTQYMAQVIQENTGADIFRIQPTTPYPTDHEELLEVAQNENRPYIISDL